MRKVKGIYEDKVVKLLEEVEAEEGTEVEVIFSNEPRRDNLGASKEMHKQIKESISEEIPELAHMSDEELKKDFEKLSRKIAGAIPFDDWKDAERFMSRMGE